MHFLLIYELAEDFVARRAPFREAHLAHAWAASDRGELILGGAMANPVDGAMTLFRGDSPEVAERFAKADPYVIHGAVKSWRVREWNTVVGETAASPLRPQGQAARYPILRMWRARSTAEKEGDYFRFAAGKVFPALRSIEGHRGAYLLRRAVGDAIEVIVLTLWESMDAVRSFAGAQVDRAVVEPEAQAVLTDFDDAVTHYEVIESSVR